MLSSKKNHLSQKIIQPQAVLFDWDNTLIDTWPILHASINAAQSAMGVKAWTLEQTKTNIRKAPRHYFAEFGDRAMDAEKAFYNHYLAHHHDFLSPASGAESLLSFLFERKILAGVISNKTGSILREEVKALGWDHLFIAVIGSGDAARDKPARDPVEMALWPVSLEPGPHIWFVGDTDIDMECAHGAGCTPIFMGRNTTNEAMALWPAAVYVDTCADLIDTLKKIL